MAFGAATPALVQQVKDVVAEASTHRYSVSRVYAAYNAVYQLHEQPSSCASCLQRRVRFLRDWLVGYNKWALAKQAATPPKMDTPDTAPLDAAGLRGTLTLNDGREVELVDGDVDGMPVARNAATGKNFAPGSYAFPGGLLVVGFGGKARVDELPLDGGADML
jgi:hypothetical protein